MRGSWITGSPPRAGRTFNVQVSRSHRVPNFTGTVSVR